MNNDLAQNAISAALSGNWGKALEINKDIIQINPDDVDALCRLSRAYAELGKLTQARQTAKQVLKHDPFNRIATKALDKWKELKREKPYTSSLASAQVFLEEPGKTKILPLLHPGGAKILSKLDPGDEVTLNTRSHRVSVLTNDGKYIGRLPDDLSAHLRKLIRYGNEYQVFIKSIDKNNAKVLIRETKRAKKLVNTPSFSTEKIKYISFTPPELVHKDKVSRGDEEEE
ncbi:tetratricopeptide repeat protein [Patescibacteria group bacterium]|nr:tetratricopeptide repeat protein [Patescibacteria group bacterium]